MTDKTRQHRTNRVFKSLHKPLTYLGVERTLFYFVCVGAVGAFNLFNSILAGIAVFIGGFLPPNPFHSRRWSAAMNVSAKHTGRAFALPLNSSNTTRRLASAATIRPKTTCKFIAAKFEHDTARPVEIRVRRSTNFPFTAALPSARKATQ